MKINFLLVFILIIFLYLISPFFATIFSSLLLSYITLPLFKKIDTRMNHKRISAIITTVFSVAAFFLIYYSFFKMIYLIITELNLFFLNINFSSLMPINETFTLNPINISQSIFSSPSKQVLETILMVFLIFYFLYEAESFFEKIKKRISRSDERTIISFKKRFDQILESIFLKYFVKTIFLGLVVFFSLYLLDITYAFEISVFSSLASLIPMFNIGIMILLLSIYYLINGNPMVFFVLLVESLFFTLIHYNFDMIIRINRSINPLLFIAGAIVGVFSLGIFGFIAGPVLAGAIQAFYETISEQ